MAVVIVVGGLMLLLCAIGKIVEILDDRHTAKARGERRH
jgi:hypothetical protein